MAEDLRRHLAGEPIAARPVGTAIRLVMWCRRKPAIASMAAALILVFLAGFAGVVTQWFRAERNYREARDQERRAVGNYRLARGAVDDTLTRISENRLFNEPGLQDLRKELLTSALHYYQEFIKFQNDDPSTQVELMGAYTRLGNITEEIGSIEEAKDYFLKGLESTRALAGSRTRDVALMSGRAEALLGASRAQNSNGQVAEAMQRSREAETIYRDLLRANPDDVSIRIGLARTLTSIGEKEVHAGKLVESEPTFREVTRILEGLGDPKPRRVLAMALRTLGTNLARIPGRTEDAIATFRTSIEIRKELVRDLPGDIWARDDLGSSYLHLGDFLIFLNQPREGFELIRLAGDLYDPLVRENPRASLFRYNRGLVNYTGGSCLLGLGRQDEALASYQRALEDIGQVARENPTTERYQSPGLAGIHLSMGEAYRSIGDSASALRSMEASRVIQEVATRKNPESFVNKVNLAMVYRTIGSVQAESGQAPAAIASTELALAILLQLAKDGPKNIMFLSEIDQGRLTMGYAYRTSGNASESLKWYRQAEADLRELSSQDPSNAEYQAQHGLCLARISAVERTMGRMSDAVSTWEKARDVVAKIPVNLPDRMFIAAVVPSIHIPLIVEKGEGAERRRRQDAGRAIESLKKAVAMGFRNKVWLEADPDLEPIRSRADFQALLRSLQKQPVGHTEVKR